MEIYYTRCTPALSRRYLLPRLPSPSCGSSSAKPRVPSPLAEVGSSRINPAALQMGYTHVAARRSDRRLMQLYASEGAPADTYFREIMPLGPVGRSVGRVVAPRQSMISRVHETGTRARESPLDFLRVRRYRRIRIADAARYSHYLISVLCRNARCYW